MPVTPQQAHALAALAADVRPHGARRWDRAETLAAIKKLAHLSLADVALAVIRAADDRDANSPFAITNLTSPHWRERAVDRPEPSVRSIGPWCATCGKSQQRHGGDHEFEPPAPKRDADSVRQIVQALKAEIQPAPTTPPATHPAATTSAAVVAEEEA